MTDRQQLVGGFLFKRNISAVLFPSNCCCRSSVTSRCTFRKNSCRACNRRKIVTKRWRKRCEAESVSHSPPSVEVLGRSSLDIAGTRPLTMHWVSIVMITVISVSYSLTSESKDLILNRLHLWPVRTVTQTSTASVTQSTSKVLICAKLVNVSGPCRRRRFNWEEEPIILTFDDETHSVAERLRPSVSGYR